jgi:hypothetical protein
MTTTFKHLRVYHAQCSKRDEVKDQVKKAHTELVDRGYMVKITDLPEDTQTFIKSAPFNHYYPVESRLQGGERDDPRTTCC